MSPKITIKKDYILLEPKDGVDYWEIRGGLARLFYVPGIPHKNRIWLFHKGPENFAYDYLLKLKDFIVENYPKDTKINKTALVVESGFQAQMANSFRQIARDLPFEIRVFSNLQSAEVWVKE